MARACYAPFTIAAKGASQTEFWERQGTRRAPTVTFPAPDQWSLSEGGRPMPRLDTLAIVFLASVTCPAIAAAQATIAGLEPDPLVMQTNSEAELTVTIVHDPIDPNATVVVDITTQGGISAPASVTVFGGQTTAAIPITSYAAASEAFVTASIGVSYRMVTVLVEEAPLMTWYRDADEDGFGSPYDTVDAETPPLGYIIVGNDCDDRFGSIHPGAEEVCDGIDNDCDGLVDQYWSQVGRPCSAGIGECERVGIWVCSPDGRNLECDAIPGAPGVEICDGCVDSDCDGVIDNGCTTGVGEHAPSLGSLEINMPNPFNPQTTIRFALPRTETVHLRIFDLSGRLVKTLIDGRSVPSGWHSVSWNGRDENSRLVASGVFFYSIEAGDFVESRRMTLVK